MKNVPRLTLLPIVLLVLCTCGFDPEIQSKLERAEALMNEDAKTCYLMLDSMTLDLKHAPQHVRMRHLMLWANARNKAMVPFESDSIGLELVHYYNRHGNRNQRMLAHYLHGCAYRDLGELPLALECFNEAVCCADTIADDCDYYQLSIIYSQIADIFDWKNAVSEALEAYENALLYAYRSADSLRIANVLANKANMHYERGEKELGLKMQEQAAGMFLRANFVSRAVKTRIWCVPYLIEKGDLLRAKKIIDDYDLYSGNVMPDGSIVPGMESYYRVKGLYYMSLNKMDSAEYFFRKELNEGKELNDINGATRGLSLVFDQLHMPDSAAKYALASYAANDSFYIGENIFQMQQNQAMYNYERQRQNALKSEIESERAHVWLMVCILASLSVACLGVWVVWQYKRLKQRETRILKQRIADTYALYVSESQKLSCLLSQNAEDLQLVSRQKETIKQMMDTVVQLKAELSKRDLEGTGINLMVHPLAVKMQGYCRNHNGRPSSDEWKELCSIVNDYYPGFYQVVHDGVSISRNEYYICVLTKIGFQVADIVYLIDTTPAYVSTTRARLVEKLFRQKGGAKDFDRLIREL